MKIYFALLPLVFTVPVVAGDHTQIVKEALSNTSNDYHQEWAFTHSATEEGIQIVGRYDPRLPDDERWQLITVDGRAPTAEEIADYRHDQVDEFYEHHDDHDNEIVNFETLSLAEETDDYWLFRFTPDVGNDDEGTARKFMRHVVGTIKIIRNGNYVQYIELRNERPIRPAFSIKISRFLTHLTFGPAGGDGPIVPLSIDVEVKGRAILFVTFDEMESIRFTDYEHVGT